MQFPLALWDISLLLAVVAIILLITSEILSHYYGKISIQINRKRLRNAALAFSVLFLVTVAIRIVGMVISR
jgi:hypothetical protein